MQRWESLFFSELTGAQMHALLKLRQDVFVVEQNKTEQRVVKSALSLLDPELVIGVVMNKTRNSGQIGYYGYYGPSHK